MKPVTDIKLLHIIIASLLLWPACAQAEQPINTTPGKPLHQTDVPMDSNFGDKIVYTTDAGINTAPLKADCDKRGGQFHECGTPCKNPSALSRLLGGETCIAVCAFTCEQIP